MENLILQSNSILAKVNSKFVRYLYKDINWDRRIVGILGSVGVGKTTMLLQRMKSHHNKDECLYVKADDLYFTDSSLYELARRFNAYGGRYLYIDELHKYPDWAKNLKMMCEFLPNLKVVVAGSVMLNLKVELASLGKRVLSYRLNGLSFREYLNLKKGCSYPSYSLQQILHGEVIIEELPLPLFKQYLDDGYYAFCKESNYLERLLAAVNTALEVDIPTQVGMNSGTSRKLMKLLYVISRNVPFRPNVTQLAKATGIHRNLLNEYLYYLEASGLITQLREQGNASKVLSKTENVFLQNPNLIKAISPREAHIGNIRDTFFLDQLQVKHRVWASKQADFQVDKYLFDLEGMDITQREVADEKGLYFVKDDIEYGYKNVVPLWQLGFNY